VKQVILELEDEQVEFLERYGDRSAAARKILSRVMYEKEYEARLRQIVREELARYKNGYASAEREARQLNDNDKEATNSGYLKVNKQGRRAGKEVLHKSNRKSERKSDSDVPEEISDKFQSELDRLFGL